MKKFANKKALLKALRNIIKLANKFEDLELDALIPGKDVSISEPNLSSLLKKFKDRIPSLDMRLSLNKPFRTGFLKLLFKELSEGMGFQELKRVMQNEKMEDVIESVLIKNLELNPRMDRYIRSSFNFKRLIQTILDKERNKDDWEGILNKIKEDPKYRDIELGEGLSIKEKELDPLGQGVRLTRVLEDEMGEKYLTEEQEMEIEKRRIKFPITDSEYIEDELDGNLGKKRVRNLQEEEARIFRENSSDGILEIYDREELIELRGLRWVPAEEKIDVSIVNSPGLTNRSFLGVDFSGIKCLEIKECNNFNDISGIDFSGLDTLILNGCKGIVDISDTDFSGVNNLFLRNLAITSLKNVNISGVKKLNLSDCKDLKDITDVDLSGVDYLDLSGSGITSLKGVNLSGIKKLDLSGSGITSLKGVNLSGIKELDLSDCKELKDISDISFTGVQRLSLGGWKEKDIIGIGWKEKDIIDIGSKEKDIIDIGSKEKDIIGGFAGVDYLNLRGSGITILGLRHIMNIFDFKELMLAECKELKSISEIDFSNMETLYLRDSGIETLQDVNISRIKELDISECKELKYIKDVNISNIETLNLSRSGITDIDAHFSEVKNLNLCDCKKLKSIVYASFSGVGTLNFRGSGITSIRRKNFSGIKKLNLSNTSILDWKLASFNVEELVISLKDKETFINLIKTRKISFNPKTKLFINNG